MAIPNSVPAVVEAAFSDQQIAALRSAMATCRPLMPDNQRRANSIGFDELRRLNEAGPLSAALEMFVRSRAHDYAMQQFPDGYCFLLRNCSFRYHDPSSTRSHLAMHFDANFIGLGGKAINVWVPLVDLGDGVPGLTFLSPAADPLVLYPLWRAKRDAAVKADGPGAVLDFFVPQDQVRAAYPELGDDAFFTPHIRAGGFLAFHQLVMHSTEVVAPPSKPRGSIEFRIAGIHALPDVYRHRELYCGVAQVGANGACSVQIMESRELAAG